MIKALQPSLREKKRYVAFEIMSASPARFGDAQRAILQSLHSLFGVAGASKFGVQFIDVWKNQRGVIRIGHRFVDHLKAGFCFARIQGKEVICRSLGVSGMVQKAIQRTEGVR